VAVDLEKWRADPAHWSAAAYTAETDEQGLPDDANREKRAEVLALLLRDRRDSDVELLRYLVEQEVLMHRAYGSIADSLYLAALLLSECGRAEDVWLLWAAKGANFDTFTGLDGVLLYPAGVSDTIAYVERSDHPDRDEVLAYLTDYLVHEPMTEEQRGDRLASLRAYHAD
jgi:hypothetical protein